MSDSPSLDAVLALLSDGGPIPPPTVSEVVSVIRSGNSFLIGPPGPVPTAPAGMFIAPLVVEWGYDVEYDRARQFQRWLQDNEPRLRELGAGRRELPGRPMRYSRRAIYRLAAIARSGASIHSMPCNRCTRIAVSPARSWVVCSTS